jgi:hypothetical protein
LGSHWRLVSENCAEVCHSNIINLINYNHWLTCIVKIVQKINDKSKIEKTEIESNSKHRLKYYSY